jgi:hypothetical protein
MFQASALTGGKALDGIFSHWANAMFDEARRLPRRTGRTTRAGTRSRNRQGYALEAQGVGGDGGCE